MDIDPTTEAFIERARIARLATANSESVPHIVPVVFVFDGKYFFIPLDQKRKRTVRPEGLKRVRNINVNPNVALLIDEYSENWAKLAFVMIQGQAKLVYSSDEKGNQLQDAYEKLKVKYPQYQKIGLGQTCIMIQPKKVASWNYSG